MVLGEAVRQELREFLAHTPGLDETYIFCVQKLKAHFPKYDWVGIYLLAGNELVVHNYLGAPTPHTRIALGSGICGAAAAEEKTIVVPDVNADPRYLACSVETKSEIVVPIKGRRIYGEIDIDSHTADAFWHNDTRLLEAMATQLAALNDQLTS
ncbi:MAG: GAF domain-containing protein [candidate division KSB1 bacterium]|nr:GAF domain-containing protein [candidate division KSB1 bacterium]MDZ7299829.1 GAF domain-containing protein [candidate division KSB1 bacterium]MDZ7309266.1 GAF domain-containing protein [candidate division KSB1 bacterium]MDZ7355195.1 GAF domain-containing protein [candidate division KSB1 bacterium]MDZ7417947.1 GAF domain-containing protein [candidate division KSB1 bacterium]